MNSDIITDVLVTRAGLGLAGFWAGSRAVGAVRKCEINIHSVLPTLGCYRWCCFHLVIVPLWIIHRGQVPAHFNKL